MLVRSDILLPALVLFISTYAQEQIPLSDILSDKEPETWLSKYGKPIDQPFSGFLSFSHTPHAVCLEDEKATFDIAILGFPFDTGVSYRPGARFGPFAIRSGSRRQRDSRGYTLAWGVNPYDQGVSILDCGDVKCIYLSTRTHTYKCSGSGNAFR